MPVMEQDRVAVLGRRVSRSGDSVHLLPVVLAEPTGGAGRREFELPSDVLPTQPVHLVAVDFMKTALAGQPRDDELELGVAEQVAVVLFFLPQVRGGRCG